MKQILTVETENKVVLSDALTKYNYTLEEFNQFTIDTWNTILKLISGDDIGVVTSVKTLE